MNFISTVYAPSYNTPSSVSKLEEEMEDINLASSIAGIKNQDNNQRLDTAKSSLKFLNTLPDGVGEARKFDSSRNYSSQKPLLNLGDLKNIASVFFNATIGSSKVIENHYDNLSKDYLGSELTPENVSDFVTKENEAIVQYMKSNYSSSTSMDKVAYAATPLRRIAGHFVAQHAFVGRMAFFSDNEYAIEAKLSLFW